MTITGGNGWPNLYSGDSDAIRQEENKRCEAAESIKIEMGLDNIIIEKMMDVLTKNGNREISFSDREALTIFVTQKVNYEIRRIATLSDPTVFSSIDFKFWRAASKLNVKDPVLYPAITTFVKRALDGVQGPEESAARKPMRRVIRNRAKAIIIELQNFLSRYRYR